MCVCFTDHVHDIVRMTSTRQLMMMMIEVMMMVTVMVHRCPDGRPRVRRPLVQSSPLALEQHPSLRFSSLLSQRLEGRTTTSREPTPYCTSITADMTSAGIYEKLKVSISGIRRPLGCYIHALQLASRNKQSLKDTPVFLTTLAFQENNNNNTLRAHAQEIDRESRADTCALQSGAERALEVAAGLPGKGYVCNVVRDSRE